MAFPTAGTWTLDTDKTKVSFVVKNFIFKSVPGTFDVASGSATVGGSADDSSVAVSISAASFSTGNEKRDEHVRAADFFDSEQFPTIDFASTKIVSDGSSATVTGDLTVLGSATPVTFELTSINIDGDNATFSASATINRKAIGVTKMPGLMIGHDVPVTITGTATRS